MIFIFVYNTASYQPKNTMCWVLNMFNIPAKCYSNELLNKLGNFKTIVLIKTTITSDF